MKAAAEFLSKAVKPVMVAGPKLRMAKASDAFVELADTYLFSGPIFNDYSFIS